MRITDIYPDHRAPDYLVIEVDGARFVSLTPEAVKKLRLKEGVELNARKLERVQRAADVTAAYRVAVRLLALRPRAVNELLRKLRERGHNPSVVAEVVGRLESQGLLDDTKYAQHFARIRSARGHGPGRLLSDLLARGVDRRVAERAIDTVLDAENIDPTTQARALAIKRARQLGDLPRRTKRRRLLAYLERRGFRGGGVIETVDELLRESEPGELP